MFMHCPNVRIPLLIVVMTTVHAFTELHELSMYSAVKVMRELLIQVTFQNYGYKFMAFHASSRSPRTSQVQTSGKKPCHVSIAGIAISTPQ